MPILWYKNTMSLNISDYSYDLAPEFIASSPVSPRDTCKLLIIDRQKKEISHNFFYNILDYLRKGDVLVFNQSKVFPARLFANKITGGNVEILLDHQIENDTWIAVTKPGLKPQQRIIFPTTDLMCTVINKDIDGDTVLKFNYSGNELFEKIDQVGQVPLPNYIHTNLSKDDLKREYQTVYAKDIGSSAAPTAGLHFTQELIDKIKEKGIQIEYITLHVGLGTFQSLRPSNLTTKKLHQEFYNIDSDVASRLNFAKNNSNRIIAVGTTSTRALESACQNGQIVHGYHSTDIFIYPTIQFNFISALITNFHLPESSLLMLVSSFVSFPNTSEKFINFSKSLIGKAYKEAINNNYRFFSFGDAMLII